uniref:ADP,ATP carrier protein n=1 Tax=Aegilops tauschii subsp. strangulata TaxID=200361 RepID=A0A453MHY5_AEGTS
PKENPSSPSPIHPCPLAISSPQVRSLCSPAAGSSFRFPPGLARRGRAAAGGRAGMGASGGGEDKPFNFLQILCEGVIAGGAAGVVVETALYPIDTIKTRLQAARAGSQIQWKGLYSGLGGNLVGVLP